MKKFKSRGIHTRLHALVERAGGIDRDARIDYLRDKYNLSVQEAMVVWEYDYEVLVQHYGKKEALDKIVEHKERKKEDGEKALRNLAMLWNMFRR